MFLDIELKTLRSKRFQSFRSCQMFRDSNKKVFDLEKKHKWAERPLPPGERVAELFVVSVTRLVVLLLSQD